MANEHLNFVTGRLAEPALRSVLEKVASRAGFDYSISVLKISVAALMTIDWIARHLHVPAEATRVIIPGLCAGDLGPLERAAGRPVERGPKDLRDLPEFLGGASEQLDGKYDIEILAEINYAPRLSLQEIVSRAQVYRDQGADVIDLGADPAGGWTGVGDAVRALRDLGLRVSIDSMDRDEVSRAVRAGAELVLSVNSGNCDRAVDWGCEVVAVPDDPRTLTGLDTTIDTLTAANVRFRIDPIVEPIGFGFAASLGRYLSVRQRYPHAEMLMGIGNLTELTDADSAGINVMLLGFCQEVGIHSVLTTAVINWARSSVRECDLGRRLVHHAVEHKTLPKRLEPRLVMLRDPKVSEFGPAALERFRQEIHDLNYRLFVEAGELHLIGGGHHLHSRDPFVLLEQLQALAPKNLDVSHAFYLGYELSKALTALTLGKQYRQDQALDWGFLTVPEVTHRAPQRPRSSRDASDATPGDEA